LKKSTIHIYLYRSGYSIFFILFLFIITSCNPTKYVPKGESLLNENHVKVNKEGVKTSDLIPYIKQTPNKRIFGTGFYLGLYNLSNINKTRWPHGWLREIGEEPVTYDPYATKKTTQQIMSYVSSKGFFDGIVTDTVKTTNRKADVYYNVVLQKPYTIRKLTYEIEDTNIKKLVFFDSVNCIIDRGKPYDVDVLHSEMTRCERFIRDHGFYGFSNEYIRFSIDSTVGHRQVDIRYIIRSFTRVDANSRISTGPFALYSVKNIFIYPDFVPKEALEGGDTYMKSLDTTLYKGYYFITSRQKHDVKYDLIIQSLNLKARSVFNVTNTELTQSHLLALKIYRLVNILYNDALENASLPGTELLLDCNIQLTLLSQQSYKIELEGTNSAGNLGGAMNLIYQHKNLFHGAELFSTKLKGAYSAYTQNNNLSSAEEYGIETSLRIPKFMIPFIRLEGFKNKYNPSTTILAAYNYQKLPVFTRTVANATFGYNWRAGDYQEHILNPVQFNIVKLPKIDKDFLTRIETSTYQRGSYMDVLILGGNYSFIFNNQKIKNSKDFWFLRINAETSGNFLSAIYKLSGATKQPDSSRTVSGPFKALSTSYHLFRQPFAQYMRADIDLRYNYKFNNVSSIVYRGFIGVAVPYGNSRAVPFEKQYFSGGANGIRAWQVRSLGPGTSRDTSRFLNETGDIKIEANAEYRFKLFWILEGAVFIDAGNIWGYNYDKDRPRSQFKFNQFYKDIAVGTGTGFRFDLKFVIARIDIGMKLRDPLLGNGDLIGPDKIPDRGSKWIFLNGPYKRNDFTIVLGIGYPF
jgi:outer membrane protein assembly factor BamA